MPPELQNEDASYRRDCIYLMVLLKNVFFYASMLDLLKLFIYYFKFYTSVLS